MPRSDLILSLVESGSRGDRTLFRRSVEAIIAEERAKRHHVLADRLEKELARNGTAAAGTPLPLGATGGADLWFEVQPRRTIDSIVLPRHVEAAFRELVEEHNRSDLLRSHGIEPRHRVLLTGPPGNGKTSLAEALASALMVPMILPRYDAIIGSYLGETATRLRRVFDHVRCRNCLLFLDEFETLGRERGDTNETGEIKRVVSSLLLQVDSLPSYAVIVVATNHPETLDRAVWRRFQLRMNLPRPRPAQAAEWFQRWGVLHNLNLGSKPESLAKRLKPTSFSELEDFCQDLRRRLVLAGPDAKISQAISTCLQQWTTRVRGA